MKETLVGIIVDVSSSMRNNWGKGPIRQTKIEAVKNVLNEEIRRIKILKGEQLDDRLKLFCLGIGFKLNLGLISVDLSEGEERKLDDRNTTLIGIIADVLTLSDLIPSQEKLEIIKTEIQQYWNSSAKTLLSDIEIDNQAHFDLAKAIEEGLMDSYRLRLNEYIENSNSSFRKTIGNFLKFIGIPMNEFVLRGHANRLSVRYSNRVGLKAEMIFEKNRTRYSKFIHDEIRNFAYEEIYRILERNGLGFSIEIILKNFDKKELLRLSEHIYLSIKNDILIEFKDIWDNHKMDFWTKKFTFISRLKMSMVRDKTEYTIKNIGWAKLKPFIEEFVFNVFSETFEEVSNTMLYSWVKTATKHESIKPISEITNIFPDSIEGSIYSDQYIFGGTPMFEAVNLATLRFNKSEFKKYRKVLLIISDGEYENEKQVLKTINLNKESGVTVVCGYVSNAKSITNFKQSIRDKTKIGAQNLMSISSVFAESPELVELIEKGEINTKIKNKLCIQINQPRKLNLLLEGLLK